MEERNIGKNTFSHVGTYVLDKRQNKQLNYKNALYNSNFVLSKLIFLIEHINRQRKKQL